MRFETPAAGRAPGAPGPAAGANGRAGPGREAYFAGLICPQCEEALPFVGDMRCAKCGKPLAGAAPPGLRPEALLCRDCASRERMFVRCRCLMKYGEAARELMTEIKYHGKREYTELLAALAADRLGDWIRELSPDCLVPVPVHPKRLRTRGYNQAGEIARHLGRLTGIPVREDLLVRTRNTFAQKELNAGQRLLNLQQAFACTGRLPQGSGILLLDDIYTTGSTMEACTERLLEAGAAAVWGLCICGGEDICATFKKS